MRGEHVKQIEFLLCQVHRFPAHRRGPLLRIDEEIARAHLAGSVPRWRRGGIRGPPEQCRDTRHQLADSERFGEVIVSAALEPEYLV